MVTKIAVLIFTQTAEWCKHAILMQYSTNQQKKKKNPLSSHLASWLSGLQGRGAWRYFGDTRLWGRPGSHSVVSCRTWRKLSRCHTQLGGEKIVFVHGWQWVWAVVSKFSDVPDKKLTPLYCMCRWMWICYLLGLWQHRRHHFLLFPFLNPPLIPDDAVKIKFKPSNCKNVFSLTLVCSSENLIK